MTDDKMALVELIEKRADADFVRQMLAFSAERLMEVGQDRCTSRPAQPRSGESSQRLSRARLGHPGMSHRACHPQAAQGQLLAFLLGETRRTAEKALTAVIQEAGACPSA